MKLEKIYFHTGKVSKIYLSCILYQDLVEKKMKKKKSEIQEMIYISQEDYGEMRLQDHSWASGTENKQSRVVYVRRLLERSLQENETIDYQMCLNIGRKNLYN